MRPAGSGVCAHLALTASAAFFSTLARAWPTMCASQTRVAAGGASAISRAIWGSATRWAKTAARSISTASLGAKTGYAGMRAKAENSFTIRPDVLHLPHDGVGAPVEEGLQVAGDLMTVAAAQAFG